MEKAAIFLLSWFQVHSSAETVCQLLVIGWMKRPIFIIFEKEKHFCTYTQKFFKEVLPTLTCMLVFDLREFSVQTDSLLLLC